MVFVRFYVRFFLVSPNGFRDPEACKKFWRLWANRYVPFLVPVGERPHCIFNVASRIFDVKTAYFHLDKIIVFSS